MYSVSIYREYNAYARKNIFIANNIIVTFPVYRPLTIND